MENRNICEHLEVRSYTLKTILVFNVANVEALAGFGGAIQEGNQHGEQRKTAARDWSQCTNFWADRPSAAVASLFKSGGVEMDQES